MGWGGFWGPVGCGWWVGGNLRLKTFHKNLTSNPPDEFTAVASERSGHFTCIVLHRPLLPKYTIFLDESSFSVFYIP